MDACVYVVTVQGGNDIITLYTLNSVKQQCLWSTENILKLQGVYIAAAVNVSLLTFVKMNESINLGKTGAHHGYTAAVLIME